MCIYLCVLVCVHLSSHCGIVNTDSFQLESALFNKQTSREESREVYKEMTRQHETSAPWNHQGGGQQVQVDEQGMLGMQMKAMKPGTRSTVRSEWQPCPV